MIPASKLRDYALNADHLDGRHKARVFRAALGFGREDWEDVRDQIAAGVQTSPVVATEPRPPWGTRYEVVIDVTGRNGQTRPVMTGWLLPSDGPPTLVTAFVAPIGGVAEMDD